MEGFKERLSIFMAYIFIASMILFACFDWEGYFESKNKQSNIEAEIKQVELIVTGVDEEIVKPDVKYYCYYPYENNIIKSIIILNKYEVIKYNWDNKEVGDKVKGLLLIDKTGVSVEVIKDQNKK